MISCPPTNHQGSIFKSSSECVSGTIRVCGRKIILHPKQRQALQLMYHLHQLLTQADGISLGYEDHTVESIGNDKDRKLAGIR